MNSCADYYAAAAMYEQLSRLSNAELHKRGFRATRLPAMSFNPATSQVRGKNHRVRTRPRDMLAAPRRAFVGGLVMSALATSHLAARSALPHFS